MIEWGLLLWKVCIMSSIFDGRTIDLEGELADLKIYSKLNYRKAQPHKYISKRKQQIGMSNKQLATKLGISESLMSKILNGERMTRDNLIKIAVTLEMELIELNQLMKYYNYSTLYVKDERDQIVLHGFLNRYSIEKINSNLKQHRIKQLL